MKFSIIRKLVYLFIIVFTSCTTVNETQKKLYESKLQIADEVYQNNDYQNAIFLYEDVLLEIGNKNEYIRAVILFRIASIQKYTGDEKGLKETTLLLDKLRKQYKLPYYYNKKIDSLSLKSDELKLGKTAIPEDNIIYTVYLSSNGDDNNPGTENSSVKTFEAALKKIREKRNSVTLEKGSLQILILDNINLENPVEFSHNDSGTEKNPLLISGNDKKIKIEISGAKKIGNWRKIKNTDTKIVLTDEIKNKIIIAEIKTNQIDNLGALAFGGFGSGRGYSSNIPELFYSGTVQKMSSWPNNGYTDIEISEKYTKNRISRWVDEKEAWLHGYWKYSWADSYEKIEKIDIKNRIITLAPPLSRYGFREPKARIINAVSEIDIVGEWAVDTEAGLLFYYPPDDFQPEQLKISYTPGVFKINNCNFIKIENLDIKYSKGNVIDIKDSENIIINKCIINNASGTGLIINGKTNHVVHSTVFNSLGGGAIKIKAGDWKTLKNSGTVIENCIFSDISRIDKTYTPGIWLEGMNQQIRNNDFFNIPSSAIRLDTNNVLVEYNKFYNCVYESGDQGVIDAWGNPLYRGNVIRWNYFYDITNNLHDAASIRLDDAISGYTIYENIFENGSSGDFGVVQINGGKNNLIEGNIIKNSSPSFSKRTWRKKSWKKNIYIKKFLKQVDWNNDLWLDQYPYLSGVKSSFTGENYYIDNIIINTEKVFKGSFTSSLLFNNKVIKNNKADLSEIILIMQRNRKIPFDRIGNYKE